MKNLMAGGLFFFIGLGCQKVVHNLAIVKLHKAETVFVTLLENLSFSYFRTTEQNKFGFVQFDRPKIENHLLTPESL